MSLEPIEYPLGEYISLFGGGTPSKDKSEFWNGGIPWASVKDLVNRRLTSTQDSISTLGLANSASKLVKAGSIIIATRMAVGRVAITDIDVAINQDLKAITCSERLDSKYLFYFLLSQEGNLNKLASGATVKGIKTNHILDMKIPLLPIIEQQKIAAILDAADSLRQKDQQLVERYTALSQSLFLEMFGGKTNSKVPLSSLCVVNPKKSEIAAISKSTEVSFVPMAKVSEQGEVDLTESRTIEEVWTGFTYFSNEDVVFAKITPCMENGKGGIMRNLKNKIGFGTTEFHVLRPIPNITTAEWLFYLTKQKSFRETAEKNMTGSAGQKRVPTKFFDTYLVKKPSYEKQIEFAERIQLIDAQKQQAQCSLEKSEALFNSLLQRAFTGKLTTKMAA